MDPVDLPLEEYLENFDPDTFLNQESSMPVSSKLGMKSLSEDPMTSCSFSEDTGFMSSENIPSSPPGYQHNIPCTNEVVGSHNFKVELGTQPKRVANPDWVYKNDKLYIKPSTMCPIVLSTSPSLPPSCTIKIMPIFKNQADIRDVVRCCPNHTVMDANSNGFSSVAHFIRCDNERVSYKECPLTGRYYLTIPFIPSQQDPTTKTLSTHELFSFICNNSCGGLNRRATQVIFELAQGQTILGRRLIEVRVCACPGRDSKNDDSLKQPFRRKRRLQTTEEPLYMHVEEPSYHPEMSSSVHSEDHPPPRRKKPSAEIFYLKINGRQNFVIMERICKALELFTSMEKRFFSKNFPFQALEHISRSSHNESQEFVEPDSTLYRRNSCQENSSLNDHASSLSPNGMVNWPDSTHQHSHTHQTPNSSPSISVPYSSHAVRRTSIVN